MSPTSQNLPNPQDTTSPYLFLPDLERAYWHLFSLFLFYCVYRVYRAYCVLVTGELNNSKHASHALSSTLHVTSTTDSEFRIQNSERRTLNLELENKLE